MSNLTVAQQEAVLRYGAGATLTYTLVKSDHNLHLSMVMRNSQE